MAEYLQGSRPTVTESDRPSFDELLAVARAGGAEAFDRLSSPFRRELLGHCYRMMGAASEAEDMVQETMLRAWRGLNSFQGRGSFRAWLYRIATNACLDSLKNRPRRLLPSVVYPTSTPDAPLPAPTSEALWLEPIPDELLAAPAEGPDARFDRRESVRLSFLVALQTLPPRQRCVLIMSDVLDWRASEIAESLEISVSSVNSLLHRARSTLSRNYRPLTEVRAPARDDELRELLDRYLHAWEAADVPAIVSLLKSDCTFVMPPSSLWLRGREPISEFLSGRILFGEARERFRLAPVLTNGRPSFALYYCEEDDGRYQAYAIQVLELVGNEVADITTFFNPTLFPLFNLPPELA